MRVISLLLVAAATLVSGQTFCKTYTKAVFNLTDATLTPQAQYNLISAVVTRTILGCNTPDPSQSASGAACSGLGSNATTVVTGLADSGSNNLEFFNGVGQFVVNSGAQAKNTAAQPSIPAGPGGSTVFVTKNGTKATPTPAALFLIGHLIEFFGAPLGCDVNATSTSASTGIAAYGGISDMKVLHKDMKINKLVWGGFVNALADTLVSYGVPAKGALPALTVESVIVPYAQTFLKGSASEICNQADCDLAPTAAPTVPGSTTAPPTVPGSTTQPPTTPAPKTNNTATAVSASPIIVGAAVALTMLF